MKELRETFVNYHEVGKKMAQAYIDGGPEEGNKTMAGFDEAAANLVATLDPVVEEQIAELEESVGSIVTSSGLLQVAS